MHFILSKLLNRRGIKDVSELKGDEKATFDKWQGILSEEITVETIAEFCRRQISAIEAQFRDMANTGSKNDRLICQHVVYKSILEAITAPKAERENLEKYLESLLT